MKKMFPFRFGAAGVVSSAKSSGLNIFAKLTTPSAPLRWLRDFLLMPQPPLLCEEGNEDGVKISSDFKLPPFSIRQVCYCAQEEGTS